jgi:hypothetical protein
VEWVAEIIIPESRGNRGEGESGHFVGGTFGGGFGCAGGGGAAGEGEGVCGEVEGLLLVPVVD